jgi:hypothetical protein
MRRNGRRKRMRGRRRVIILVIRKILEGSDSGVYYWSSD